MKYLCIDIDKDGIPIPYVHEGKLTTYLEEGNLFIFSYEDGKYYGIHTANVEDDQTIYKLEVISTI
jgi:hypothetical protein